MAINSVTGERFNEFSPDGLTHYVEIGGIVRALRIGKEDEQTRQIILNENHYAANMDAAMKAYWDEQYNWVPEYRKFQSVKGLTPAEYSLMFVQAFPNSPAAARYADAHPTSDFAEGYKTRNPYGYIRKDYQHPNDK